MVEAAGGFATVLAKGHRDAGTLAVVTISRQDGAHLFERMPQRDGTRAFVRTKSQDTEKPYDFSEYIQRRQAQDPDLWIVELDIADAERFVAELAR